MLSQTAEYALRAVICLVTYPDKPMTVPEIAEITKVPPSYLSKVLQSLRKAKILRSQRGLHGGFRLAKSPDKLSLLEVINSVDPIQAIHECPLGLEQHGKKLCALHTRLNDTIFMAQKVFQESSVQEMIPHASECQALCKKPPRK
jgi:Rrf2 family protein